MSDDGSSGADIGNQSQYSHLTGQWTFNLTATASGLHLYQLQTNWAGASIDVFADPQFQWVPSTSLSPAQWALSAHLINMHWPTLGPFVIQTFIDGQFQVTNGQGATSIVTGVQIAPRAFDSLSIGGQISIDTSPGTGGISSRVDPQGTFSLSLSF